MLLGQDLRRRHQGHVEAALHRHQRAAGGHHRLARADIALQQPAHRMRPPPMSWRISRSTRVWAPVRVKPSCVRNGLISRLSPAQGSARALACRLPTPALDGELQIDELVQRQPAPGQGHVRQLLREMQQADRLGRATGRSGSARPGQRLGHASGADLRQRRARATSAASAAASPRQRIDRHDAGSGGSRFSSPASRTSVSGWSIVRGRSDSSLPKTMTSSPTVK